MSAMAATAFFVAGAGGLPHAAAQTQNVARPTRRPVETAAKGAEAQDGGEALRHDVMEKMRAMRAWRLSEGLSLDEATAAKLFPLLARYDDREREIMKERSEAVRGLRAESEAPKPDGARIGSYIDRLLQSRTRQHALEDEKIKDLRKILSPMQQAKLLLLLPRIEHAFQQRIRDAMEDRWRRRRASAVDEL